MKKFLFMLSLALIWHTEFIGSEPISGLCAYDVLKNRVRHITKNTKSLKSLSVSPVETYATSDKCWSDTYVIVWSEEK